MEADTNKLDPTYVLRLPIIESAIQALQFTPKSHGKFLKHIMGGSSKRGLHS